ncbi:MAG: PIG-L family deacetylase [Candidatus Aenigmarchaeota archaeon]|nr:PIG-L family deacetylase [Candidatus Aenigmarchaeota archaeon]
MEGKVSRVVVIGAHPDDFEIGAGMRIIHHIRKGDYVVGVLCTDGERGGDPQIRLKEAESSAKSLGLAKLHCFHLPDANLLDLIAVKDMLEKIIEMEKPDVVYTHFRKDTHQDHRTVSKASSIACRRVPVILNYKSPSTIVSEFHPHLFHVGNEEDMRKKEETIKLFKSQLAKYNNLDLRRIKIDASYYASTLQLGENFYAEPFFANHFILNFD